MAVVGKGSRTALANRTAQGTENVNFTLPNNTDHIILGCGVGDDNGDRMRTNNNHTIQWRTGADAFVNLAATGAVKFGATNLVEGNALLVGERLSTGLFGSYINGEEHEATNPDTYPIQVRDDTTEMQWSIDFSGAAASTTYDFQVIWEFELGSTTLAYISITTAAAAGGDTELLGGALPGAYNITGFAATLLVGNFLNAVAGAYNITGFAAQTDRAINLNAEPGSYLITGFAATTLYDRLLSGGAVAGSYAITGFAAQTNQGIVLAGGALPGAYVITGFAAETKQTGTNLAGGALPGAYVITGFAAEIKQTAINLAGGALPGEYVVTGFLAQTSKGFVLLGGAEPGEYLVTGFAVTTLYDRLLAGGALPGSYLVTGFEAGTTFDGTVIQALKGTYNVTGFPITTLIFKLEVKKTFLASHHIYRVRRRGRGR